MIQISWLCISNVLFDLNDKILPESNRLISIQQLYMETGPRTCIYLQAVQFLCLQSLSAEKNTNAKLLHIHLKTLLFSGEEMS